MKTSTERIKKDLLSRVEKIAEEIAKGRDVEVRMAPDGSIKVLAVKKQLLETGTT